MRIAIVHDWLDTWGGAENVLATLLELYPDADLYAVVDFLTETHRRRLGARPIRTSFIQRLPFARRHFRKYLALMPLAVEQFDLADYELVISSSHAVAKGVLTGPDQLHVCLCYSPARYAWDLEQVYLASTGLDRGPLSWLVRGMLRRFRKWDARAALRVDRFVAISDYIARRIEKSYHRPADVIYPPVNVARYTVSSTPRLPFYMTLTRLVPYKRVELLAQAFAVMPERQLVIVGDGPDRNRIAAAAPANVKLVGHIADDERDRLLASARAFIIVAEEDFGIAPLEAQACGTPVIAYSRGGVAETVRGLDSSKPTGTFFGEQSVASIREAVMAFEQSAHRITADACRANAERFAPEIFRRRFADYVAAALDEFQAERRPKLAPC